jgi:hypothetical protein
VREEGSGRPNITPTSTGVDYTSEYNAYYAFQNSRSSLSPEDASYYQVLKDKVSTFGIEALDKKGIYGLPTLGSSVDPNNKSGYHMYQGSSSVNPVILDNYEELKKRTVLNPSAVKKIDNRPGLFVDYNVPGGVYYFVREKKGLGTVANSQAKENFNLLPSVPINYKPQTPEPWTMPRKKVIFKDAKPAVDKQLDLIFNSSDYQTTYQSEIAEINLSLIQAGDDIISNYNYESIDSLPDIDIEIRVDGDYLNSKDVIEKGLLDGNIESTTDLSEADTDYNLANKILLELERLIGESSTESGKFNYFGYFDNSKVNFISGKIKDDGSIDFNVELSDQYNIPGVNEITIRFEQV